MESLPRTWIGGFPIVDTTAATLLARLNARLAAGERTELFFANTNFVLGCRPHADALRAPEVLIANDGIGMNLACRMLHRRAFTANLNGTDFTPLLLERLEAPARVFLLGSTPAAVRKAARAWSTLPHVRIVGAVDGFEGLRDDEGLVDNIARTGPDILLVALGNPRQEEWILAHRGRLDVPLVVGVGALFDFVSGRSRRAPAFVRFLRLEWLHRLAYEPRRLFKRYTVDLVRFFVHCARTRGVAGSA